MQDKIKDILFLAKEIIKTNKDNPQIRSSRKELYEWRHLGEIQGEEIFISNPIGAGGNGIYHMFKFREKVHPTIHTILNLVCYSKIVRSFSSKNHFWPTGKFTLEREYLVKGESIEYTCTIEFLCKKNRDRIWSTFGKYLLEGGLKKLQGEGKQLAESVFAGAPWGILKDWIYDNCPEYQMLMNQKPD